MQRQAVVRSERLWGWVALGLFFAYFLIGLRSYADHGMSTDEVIQRHHGLVSLKYLLGLLGVDLSGAFAYLEKIPDLADYPHRSYGVVFHLPLLLIEHVVRDKVASNVLWEIRHLYTFCWFFVGALFFYRLARLWYSTPYAILATLLLVASPRIYADSFYNVKDTAFLAIFNVALYFSVLFLRRPDHGNAVRLALAVAVMLNVRFFGLFLPAFVGALAVVDLMKVPRDRWSRAVRPLLTMALCTAVFTWMLWPAAWSNPFTFFVDTFVISTNYDVYKGIVVYLGHRFPADDLPWHYIPFWILISTPLHHVVLLAASILLFPVWIRRGELPVEGRAITLMVSMVLLLPLLAVLFHSTLNTNWRHFYFLQAPLSLLAPLSLQYALRDRPWWRVGLVKAMPAAALLAVALTGVGYHVAWLYRNHPHQQVFFNRIAIDRAQTDFLLDGWGLSIRHGIEHIAAIDSRPKIYVNSMFIERHMLLVSPEIRQRLHRVLAPERADYIVDTAHWSRTYPPATGRWDEVYRRVVDGVVIMRVWKKQVPEPGG